MTALLKPTVAIQKKCLQLKRFRMVAIAFLFIFTHLNGYAQGIDPNFHIYLLTGQSNMTGSGSIEENIDTYSPRVKMMTKEGKWVTAVHPIHYSGKGGVGPGIAFALKMLEGANPKVTIGLIPTAVGGQGIEVFAPGVTNERTKTSIYDESITRIREAKKLGVFKGVLFHQGESNSGKTFTTWPDKVKDLIKNLRTDLNDPNMPFVIGELSYFRTTSPNINNLLPQLIAEVPYTAWVSAKGLMDKGDRTHFNSASASELGKRFAVAMKGLNKPAASQSLNKPAEPQLLIPDGFTETKDIVYFDLDVQGSKGTVEKVIGHYNKFIVGKVKGFDQPASSKSDLKDKSGQPFDWSLRMDIIHPKTPSKPRPVFLVVSTATKRNMHRHTPFQQYFAKRGYVTVIIDHAYSPLAHIFGHKDSYYSLDDITGVKAYTAAVRYLRANAKKYSIDPDRIGGLGHSKGSYAITRLSDPTINAESPERFGKIEANGKQPNTEYPSHIQVGYQSMGNGTRSSKIYVKDDYAPTITAVGKKDKYNHWAAWPVVEEAYAKDHDANWLGIPMLDKGHDMATGLQPDQGYIREQVVEKFFSSYLEPTLAPNILYVTPYNGDVAKNSVSPTQPVVIHFSPQMDVNSVKSASKVFNADNGKQVEGTWKVSRKGTYFVFTPKEGKFTGKNFKVIIDKKAKSINGVSLANIHEHLFSITDE
jgi:hypothetical protein